MIRYDLVCEKRHSFESWFADSKSGDRQLKRGLVACPVCGSVKVAKAIMAPSLGKSARAKKAAKAQERQPVALFSDKEREAHKLLQAFREHVIKNAEHVGERFPRLARQMHYEEIAPRSIYGDAKPEEVRELLEEGVALAPLPVLPEERN